MSNFNFPNILHKNVPELQICIGQAGTATQNTEAPLGPLIGEFGGTTNFQGSIKSNVAGDVFGVGGVQQVRITYLDQNFAGPFTDIINLNGTAIVATNNSNICYIDKIDVTLGNSIAGSGLIFYANPTGTGSADFTVNVLPGPLGGLWLGSHWIPSGKTCYITSLYGESTPSVQGAPASTDGGRIILKYRSTGIPYNFSLTNNYNYTIVDTLRIIGAQNGRLLKFTSPIKIEGPAKVGMNFFLLDSSGTNKSFAGYFTYYEV